MKVGEAEARGRAGVYFLVAGICFVIAQAASELGFKIFIGVGIWISLLGIFHQFRILRVSSGRLSISGLFGTRSWDAVEITGVTLYESAQGIAILHLWRKEERICSLDGKAWNRDQLREVFRALRSANEGIGLSEPAARFLG